METTLGQNHRRRWLYKKIMTDSELCDRFPGDAHESHCLSWLRSAKVCVVLIHHPKPPQIEIYRNRRYHRSSVFFFKILLASQISGAKDTSLVGSHQMWHFYVLTDLHFSPAVPLWTSNPSRCYDSFAVSGSCDWWGCLGGRICWRSTWPWTFWERWPRQLSLMSRVTNRSSPDGWWFFWNYTTELV